MFKKWCPHPKWFKLKTYNYYSGYNYDVHCGICGKYLEMEFIKEEKDGRS